MGESPFTCVSVEPEEDGTNHHPAIQIEVDVDSHAGRNSALLVLSTHTNRGV